MKKSLLIALILALSFTSGLSSSGLAEERLKISSTTSTDNTGLFQALNPPFEKRFGCRVDVIAVGTGKALKIGEMGDSDVVFVHSRPAEDAFVAAGHGVNRRDVMYNDFIIVGPTNDPAGIRGTGTPRKPLPQSPSPGHPSSPGEMIPEPTRKKNPSGRKPVLRPKAGGILRPGRAWVRSSKLPTRKWPIP